MLELDELLEELCSSLDEFSLVDELKLEGGQSVSLFSLEETKDEEKAALLGLLHAAINSVARIKVRLFSFFII